MAVNAPAIVLVEPQLGENIGAAARAMRNFGLSDLRLVAPRDGWPNPRAEPMASGATDILATARLYTDLPSAVADLNHVLATTARARELAKPTLSPRAAAQRLRGAGERNATAGILFGRERTGLDNEEMLQSEALIYIPTNPSFSSLNLAQAVLLLGYEWWLAGAADPAEDWPDELATGATHADRARLADHLVTELDAVNFFRPASKRAASVAKLRNLLFRVELSSNEVRMLRGVVHALATGEPGERQES